MKRLLAALFAAALFLATPVCVSAETPSETATAAPAPTLFFDPTESVDTRYQSGASPVVWVFISLGAAAVAATGVLVYLNRRDRAGDDGRKM